jgi:quercetin dioxygenase-like cupin family protein
MASLEPLIDALDVLFTPKSPVDAASALEVAAFAKLVHTISTENAEAPQPAEMAYEAVLTPLISNAMRGGMAEFAQALAEAAPLVNWSYRYAEAEWRRDPVPLCANGSFVGPLGVIRRDDLLIDFFALAPHQYFPPHGHATSELDYVISGWPTVQTGDEEPKTWPPGSFVPQPSNVPHAMWSGPDGILVMILWRGDLDTPFWRTTSTMPLPQPTALPTPFKTGEAE